MPSDKGEYVMYLFDSTIPSSFGCTRGNVAVGSVGKEFFCVSNL